jgi:hypothetical protein
LQDWPQADPSQARQNGPQQPPEPTPGALGTADGGWRDMDT